MRSFQYREIITKKKNCILRVTFLYFDSYLKKLKALIIILIHHHRLHHHHCHHHHYQKMICYLNMIKKKVL